MNAARLPDAERASQSFPPAPRQRWFAGLTWNGLALIALLSMLNASRRNIYDFFDIPFGKWLGVGDNLLTGLIELLLITLAMVATYNRAPSPPRWRYPALALAIGISSIAGIRERLSALYGGDASLVLQRQGARVTEAVLEIPYEESLPAPR